MKTLQCMNKMDMRQLLLRSIEVWLVVAAAESIHGVARTAFLAPLTGDFAARQIAVFSGSAIIVAISYIFRNWMNAETFAAQLLAGAIWVAMTLVFEIALARLGMGLTWQRILSDYNITVGGLMPIGLTIMLFAPAIAERLLPKRAVFEDNVAVY